MLTKLKSEGHRVLIFSHMTTMLTIIEDYLDNKVGEGVIGGSGVFVLEDLEDITGKKEKWKDQEKEMKEKEKEKEEKEWRMRRRRRRSNRRKWKRSRRRRRAEERAMCKIPLTPCRNTSTVDLMDKSTPTKGNTTLINLTKTRTTLYIFCPLVQEGWESIFILQIQ